MQNAPRNFCMGGDSNSQLPQYPAVPQIPQASVEPDWVNPKRPRVAKTGLSGSRFSDLKKKDTGFTINVRYVPMTINKRKVVKFLAEALGVAAISGGTTVGVMKASKCPSHYNRNTVLTGIGFGMGTWVMLKASKWVFDTLK